MKRVLLVASSYDPAMPASMHRVRMLAWHLEQFGWAFEILVPDAEFQQNVWTEPHPLRFFAPRATVHRASAALGDRLLRALGFRNPNWRALLPLYRVGAKLLKAKRFDLVFISTTAFNLFCLGALWKRRYGVSYILDFHDPWFREVTDFSAQQRGFRWKVNNVAARHFERYSVTRAAGLIAVSPDYLDKLQTRYPASPAFARGRIRVIPFGARRDDFAPDPIRTSDEVRRYYRIAYVGVGSHVMERSFGRLVKGLVRLRKRHPELLARIRLGLYGTDGMWREGYRKILYEVAHHAGIGDLVTEQPSIIPYSRAVDIAAAADGLLVLGVNERAYMASKLFPYALTGKPLLACIHKHSQMNRYFDKYPDLGTAIHFANDDSEWKDEDQEILKFLHDVVAGKRFDRKDITSDFGAEAMSGDVAAFFDQYLGESPSLV